MQVLPSGLVVPPLPYAAGLVVATVGLAVALARLGPAVTGRHVLALVPWMLAGGAAHAVHQYETVREAGVVPAVFDPLVTAPAVYVTTFVAVAAVWVGALASVDGRRAFEDGTSPAADRQSVRGLGVVGTLALLGLVAVAVGLALESASTATFVWPVAGIVGAVLATVLTYAALRAYRPTVVAHGGVVVALFAHALDGVSTAVGVDVLGTGERTPIPRLIMEFAGTLPTAQFVGRGWLFVLAKLAVVGAIVVLLAESVEDDPTEGNLLLAFVAAVGMGPAANNLTLFLLSGAA
jgi:uncharacterized membrane protein